MILNGLFGTDDEMNDVKPTTPTNIGNTVNRRAITKGIDFLLPI